MNDSIPLPLLAVIVAGGIGGFFLVRAAYRHHLRDRKAWKAFAVERGLEWSNGGLMRHPGLSGKRNGLSVQVEYHDTGKVAITRYVLEGFPADVHLAPEGLKSLVRKALGSEEVQSGDRTFDDAVFSAVGSTLELVLGAETRKAVLAAVQEGFEIRAGKATLQSGTRDSRQVTARRLDAIEHCAAALREASARAPAILRDAAVDGGRMDAFEQLVERFAGSPEAHEAMERLRDSPNADLRVRALAALGDHRTLRLVLDDTRAPESARALAARALLSDAETARTWLEDAETPLIALLHGRTDDGRVAAAEALGRIGSGASIEPLQAAARTIGGRALRDAVEEATNRIHARLAESGAAPGQLALADVPDRAGAVSLPRAGAGAVSDPTKKSGG